MFTGLVQAVGSVVSVKRAEDSAVFTFNAPDFLRDSKVGDSISVNGVCLTAIAINGDSFDVDVMVQTLNLTSLKEIDTGSSVNLELAAKVIFDQSASPSYCLAVVPCRTLRFRRFLMVSDY